MLESMQGKSFLKLLDFAPDDIRNLITLSATLKRLKHDRVPHRVLEGYNVALVFEKSSTRTRCAFEVAAADLGMHAVYLEPSGSQIGAKESIADTARVLGRMFDGIQYRGFGQERVEELAHYAGVPVWNGLTDEWHPTQMLADMLTVQEEFGELAGKKLTFMGDARNNVANSLMVVCAKLGMHYCACGPKSLWPDAELLESCKKLAAEQGGSVCATSDVVEGARDSSVIYTDIWLSMGESAELWEERIALLSPYSVTTEVMKAARPDAIFMHCLPSFHDRNTTIGEDVYQRFGLAEMEVANDVFESSQSRVFEEAENRLHTIKAVMLATLGSASLVEKH